MSSLRIIAEAEHTVNSLETFADQGAAFVLIEPNSKKPIKHNWIAHLETLDTAKAHANLPVGGNIGLLTGHSGLVILDVDADYAKFAETFTHLSTTPTITRDNAPDRAKLVVRVTDDVPPSRRDAKSGLELLAHGKQGVISGTHPSGSEFTLTNADQDVIELTPSDLEAIWQQWTGTALKPPTPPRTRTRKSSKQDADSLVEQVKQAWLDCWAVLEHHGVTGDTRLEKQNIRVMGHGGLHVVADEPEFFYCFADGIGGDQIDCWGWCKHNASWDRHNAGMFYAVLCEMAAAAGIQVNKRSVLDSQLDQLEQWAANRTWENNRTRTRDRAVFLALIQVAREAQTPLVAPGVRRLAELSGFAVEATANALKSLREAGHLYRVDISDKFRADSYTFTVDTADMMPDRTPITTGVGKCSVSLHILASLNPHDVFLFGSKVDATRSDVEASFGKCAAELIAALMAENNLGMAEIASRTGMNRVTASKKAHSLAAVGLVNIHKVGRSKVVHLAKGWRRALDSVWKCVTTYGRSQKRVVQHLHNRVNHLTRLLERLPVRLRGDAQLILEHLREVRRRLEREEQRLWQLT